MPISEGEAAADDDEGAVDDPGIAVTKQEATEEVVEGDGFTFVNLDPLAVQQVDIDTGRSFQSTFLHPLSISKRTKMPPQFSTRRFQTPPPCGLTFIENLDMV